MSSGVASELRTSSGTGNLDGMLRLSFCPNNFQATASVGSRCVFLYKSTALRSAANSHIIISLSDDLDVSFGRLSVIKRTVYRPSALSAAVGALTGGC